MPKRATPDGEGKRVPLMARTTINLRKALEDAAASSGRSLAQEVETRLENSFQSDVLLDAFIGPDATSHNVMRAFACIFKYAPELTKKRWVDDYETLWLVKQGLASVTSSVLGHDTGLPDKPEGRSDEEHRHCLRQGAALADEVLRDLALTLPTRSAGVRDKIVSFTDDNSRGKQKPAARKAPKATE